MSHRDFRVGIIGGGMAGASLAMQFSQYHIQTLLLEQGPSLVNGPPICHLHAGGNLYREIDQQQCETLLRQSIDTLKLYAECCDYRPTLIAVPKHDPNSAESLLPRLVALQQAYQRLIEQDPNNAVLGPAEHYFRCFSKAELQGLKNQQQQCEFHIHDHEQWLIPVVQHLDLEQLQFPVILVQEFGVNVFRVAAKAELCLQQQPHCQVLTQHGVHELEWLDSQQQYRIHTIHNGKKTHFDVDFVINACGFRTGEVDDLVGHQSQRMVEFKAAYVSQWPQKQGHWPEVIFHGQRGTPKGMAQLTPYPDGYFQIHGMTQEITLFADGLVNNAQSDSSQPQLPDYLANKIDLGWPDHQAHARTQKAIDFISDYLPTFALATPAGKPLYGAQQIPGTDADLRTADIDFVNAHYVRCEIVKASSVVDAAQQLLAHFNKQNCLIDRQQTATHLPAISEQQLSTKAAQLAKQRHYPEALAKLVFAAW